MGYLKIRIAKVKNMLIDFCMQVVELQLTNLFSSHKLTEFDLNFLSNFMKEEGPHNLKKKKDSRAVEVQQIFTLIS